MKIEVDIWDITEGVIRKLKFPDGTIVEVVRILTYADAGVDIEKEEKAIQEFDKQLEETRGKRIDARRAHKVDLGKTVGKIQKFKIKEYILNGLQELPKIEDQEQFLRETLPDHASSTITKYLYKYRQYMREKTGKEKTCTKCGETKPLSEFHQDAKGRLGHQARCKDCVRELQKISKSRPDLGQSLGYMHGVNIKSKIVSELKKISKPNERRKYIKKTFPNVNPHTARKYSLCYDEWMRKHPTLEAIVEKRKRPDQGEIIGRINPTNIRRKVFEEFKEQPTKETIKKFFLDVSPKTLDTYFYCYLQWLRKTKVAEEIKVEPGDLILVKARMVTLWRDDIPLTKKNLADSLPEFSNKKLSAILATLVKNREIKYDNKNDKFEVLL